MWTVKYDVNNNASTLFMGTEGNSLTLSGNYASIFGSIAAEHNRQAQANSPVNYGLQTEVEKFIAAVREHERQENWASYKNIGQRKA